MYQFHKIISLTPSKKQRTIYYIVASTSFREELPFMKATDPINLGEGQWRDGVDEGEG